MTNVMTKFSLPSFPVDWMSLIVWAKANVSGCVDAVCDNFLKVVTSADLTKDQIAAVNAYLATLTQQGEAAKLALPHNFTGDQKVTFENQVKAKIATMSWDTMSTAQRTFSMGGTLSLSDYDSLPTS